MLIVTHFNADAYPSRTGRVPGHFRLTAGTYTARIGRHIHGDGIAVTAPVTGVGESEGEEVEATVVVTTRYHDYMAYFGDANAAGLRPFGDYLLEGYLDITVTLTEDLEGADLQSFLLNEFRAELRRRCAVYRDGWVMVESLVLPRG